LSLSPESNTEVPTPIMTDLQDIASMIQINEEATVSRTVMHAEGVRLVLFSFDKDEILSEHTAAMPVILHTLEGALEIEADGRTVTVRDTDQYQVAGPVNRANRLTGHAHHRAGYALNNYSHRSPFIMEPAFAWLAHLFRYYPRRSV